ncbi:pseudouridine synthase [Xanthobacter sp. KR7-225]|uniref:pseudouridine synthase n=1 Tax=Xanthobacter sp. KR7-225 TaxID=3156613 RepID=UPI0032B5C05C
MPRTTPPRKEKNRVPREKRALPAAPNKDAERVAKVIARAGLGSRREIEDWITAGRVAVNGKVLESPAFTVTDADAITVDGAPLPERERTRLFLYHKPRGVVTTNRDPEGRTTLFEILPQGLPRLVSVGRLDLNSEGLLLLTNDGGLARVLELPDTGWLRRYRVRANGAVDQGRLDALIKGVTVEGVEYGPIEATLDRQQGANVWLTVALREGKNREVRNVLGALGLKVGRLIRVSYGPFQLGEIAEGGIEEVKTRILRDQIGDEIAAAAGADFAGPLVERELEAPPTRLQRPAGKRQSLRDGAPDEAMDAPRRPARGPRREAPVDAPPPAPAAPRGRRQRDERERESLGTVADRKGRSVSVERVVHAAAPDRPARPGKPEGARRGRPGGKDERPAGRFGEKPRRAGPGRFAREDGAPDPRREGPRGRFARPDDGDPRRDFRKGGERPTRNSADRPPRPRREDFTGERPQRGSGDRPAPPRARRDDVAGERPQRTYVDRPAPRARRDDFAAERPPRPRGDDRGQEGAAGREGRERPPRTYVDRPAPRSRRDDFAGERPDRPARPPRPRGDDRGQKGAAAGPAGRESRERPQRSYSDRPPRAPRDDAGGERPQRREGGKGGFAGKSGPGGKGRPGAGAGPKGPGFGPRSARPVGGAKGGSKGGSKGGAKGGPRGGPGSGGKPGPRGRR